MSSSFLERIEKWRAKPEQTRRQLTFWFSAGLTALVALIWVVSLSFTLRPESQVASVVVSEKATTTEDGTSNQAKIIEGWKVITSQN